MKTDMTPRDFAFPVDSFFEKAVKRQVRRYIYPLYNLVSHLVISRSYGRFVEIPIDLWLWGQRGNDFERHRRRINTLRPLAASKILVAGCGTGRDIPSWLAYRPATVTGIDLLNYTRAWKMLEKHLGKAYPQIKIKFIQADIAAFGDSHTNTFDLIASDALLEHVRDLPAVIKSFQKMLKPGGLLYATYGPLWYSWGGDHISGYDSLASGYNHLLLAKQDYQDYLDRRGPIEHPEHDGRTWIDNDLFSYLRPKEYISHLEKSGLRRKFVSALIDPRAVDYLSTYRRRRAKLLKLVNSELDLLVSGMTIVYEKKPS